MSIYRKENPEYLRQSIKSILEQTYKCDQFVIVKDGPLTVELDEIIAYYEQKYKDIIEVCVLKENVGLGCALNEGLKICRNQLVARMDSDDIALSERCKRQVEVFEKHLEYDIVGTYIDEFINEQHNIVSTRKLPITHKEIVKFARRKNPFNHPTVMYKKEAVMRCGGYSHSRRAEDLELFTKMVNMGCIGYNIPESLLLYRTNVDNFKRRKTWVSCKKYIDVVYKNYKSGYCRFVDLMYIVLAQICAFVMPAWLYKVIVIHILRK